MTELQQRYEAETGQSIRRPPMERKLNEQWVQGTFDQMEAGKGARV
jgi:hypothetical protein